MLNPTKSAALFALLGVFALGLIFLITRDDEKPVASAPTTIESAPATTAEPLPMAKATLAPSAVPVAIAPASAKPGEALTRESIEAALVAKDTSALPAIESVDLTLDGHVAAAAIDAVGKLAAVGSAAEKKQAVRTLDGWLRQESKRESADAHGNVSILVDALGDTGSEDAVAPLVSALDSASHPLHIETLIVQSLERLDASAAKVAAPSVERFAARVTKRTPVDDMEKELAKEAIEEANTALAKWK